MLTFEFNSKSVFSSIKIFMMQLKMPYQRRGQSYALCGYSVVIVYYTVFLFFFNVDIDILKFGVDIVLKTLAF